MYCTTGTVLSITDKYVVPTGTTESDMLLFSNVYGTYEISLFEI
jgi:hypothetical protein